MEGASDQQLVAAINAGNPAAFETLYYRHRDWVVRLARRFTGNDVDALDVLQETFAYLHRKFPGFELTAQLTTFLWPVVRNLSLAARRKRTRSLAVDESVLDTLEGSASTGSVHTSDDEGLALALARLSTAHRQVVLMRFVDDLQLDEIAGLLDVPLGTVKSRLHHALGMLREDPRTRGFLES
jgi:RNA polymerase sigma-70 factor, ECF subfamily